MIVQYHPQARVEILRLIEWYYEKERCLAAEFNTEVERAQQAILAFPDFWHNVGGGYKRYLLKRFPYSMIYRIEGDILLVVSIAGHKQSENFWRGRLPE